MKLSAVLGELHKDLRALAALRNVFAHGRELWLRFGQTEQNLIDLEENPMLLPAQRLLGSGVLGGLNFDDMTYPQLLQAFYSDIAMLYFLGRAREIESKLKDLLTFPPEKQIPFLASLPDLSL